MLLLKNANAFLPDNHFHITNLLIDGKQIISFNTDFPAETIDLQGMYVLPGFIDTHLHGAMGADFSDANRNTFHTIAEYELQNGITSILPTTMTLSTQQLEKIMETAADYYAFQQNDFSLKADCLGIYLEGPFFSSEKCGAQDPSHLQLPNLTLYRNLQEKANNLIKVLALAPELADTEAFLSEAVKLSFPSDDHTTENPVFSIGHTTAGKSETLMALKNGVTRLTHFYNAMKHYDEVAWAVLPYTNCMVELICDGVHNSRERILHAFETFGSDRIVLVSDSMRATGLSDGTYTLGGQKVLVSGKDALLENGTRAGSVCNLFQCFQTALQFGIPLEDAVKAVTLNPAKSLHLNNQIGQIACGYPADLLILDHDFQLKQVIKSGQVLSKHQI